MEGILGLEASDWSIEYYRRLERRVERYSLRRRGRLLETAKDAKR